MQPADRTMITTFLLLRPVTPSRPQITNTELPAGHAFNLALRAMASRDGFQTQWFGWEDMPSTLSESTDRCVDTLVWVIGMLMAGMVAMKTLTFRLLAWQDSQSALASAQVEELKVTLGGLAAVFDVPIFLSAQTKDFDGSPAQSPSFVVEWTYGNTLKILNWTNRVVMLDLPTQPLGEQSSLHFGVDEASSSAEWKAYGRLVAQDLDLLNTETAGVVLRSLPPGLSASDASNHRFRDENGPPKTSITVSLTRTRWCTKIKAEMINTIKARRVD